MSGATIFSRNVSHFTEAYRHEWDPNILLRNANDQDIYLQRCNFKDKSLRFLSTSPFRKLRTWLGGRNFAIAPGVTIYEYGS